jgi:hypothetical protein
MRQRYLRQRFPWIALDDADLHAQGDPETVILLHEAGAILGLHIKGLADHIVLGIREDREGQPVSCAITNELAIDTNHLQSNPRRHLDDENVYRDHGEA